MKRTEAQFILTAYRPSGEDVENEHFEESLRMVQSDPELGKWFAREQAMDCLVIDKLTEVQPPAGLRDRILAGGRMSQPVVWYRQSKWMALAAALLVFALVGSYFLRPLGEKDFARFAMNYADGGFVLEKEVNDLTQLKTWLSKKKMPVPRSVPERLAALEKLGCRTVKYGDREVSIICFKGEDREYHLFITKKMHSEFYASLSTRQMESSGQWSSAAWSDNENDYVLATKGTQESLKRLL